MGWCRLAWHHASSLDHVSSQGRSQARCTWAKRLATLRNRCDRLPGTSTSFYLVPPVCAARSRDSLSISQRAFDQMQSRPRRGSLRLHPSLGRRCRLLRHGSDVPRRRLDKTRCQARKQPQGQQLVDATCCRYSADCCKEEGPFGSQKRGPLAGPLVHRWRISATTVSEPTKETATAHMSTEAARLRHHK